MQKQTIVRPDASPIAARRAGRPAAVLTLQERRIVALLRSAFGVDGQLTALSPQLHTTLGQLAAEVRRHDLVVFGSQSRFVSDDELAILSWLSALQRPSQSGQWRMANPFQTALRALADQLLREERRLPARSMLAEARIERGGCFRVELRPDPEAHAAAPRARAESAEARALALVERCRFATASQFRALGISTQKLSRMCRRGYVERVALGLYKKPEAPGAMLAS